MVIAIQRGLESRGNEVFYIGENRVADAILYNEVDTHPYYEVNNVPSAASASINGSASFGALLVNVTNKTIDDIIRILEKRVYSPFI